MLNLEKLEVSKSNFRGYVQPRGEQPPSTRPTKDQQAFEQMVAMIKFSHESLSTAIFQT
jgi:hypothetical protein